MKTSVRKDITSQTNLATNGAFLIDQRANIGGVLTTIHVNDFIADCWKVSLLSVTSCKAMNNDNGGVSFQGTGTIGQSIVLQNIDTFKFGILTTANSFYPLTASVNVLNGASSVSMQVNCTPKFWSTHSATLYSYAPTVAVRTNSFPTTVINTIPALFDTPSTITITLSAAGTFNFTIYNFKLLAGSYSNTPAFIPVNYLDDLKKCYMFYQTSGSCNVWSFARTAGGSTLLASLYVPFLTPMITAPTISTTLTTINCYKLAELGGESVLNDQSAWILSTDSITTKGFTLIATRSSDPGDISIINILYSWTATV